MTMGNLWQFFGLPDPDAGGAARVVRHLLPRKIDNYRTNLLQ